MTEWPEQAPMSPIVQLLRKVSNTERVARIMQTIKSRQSRSDNLGKERTWLVGVSIVNGEESNKCNLCDYLLSQVGHLRTHMKMLRGERSNECNQCIDSAVPSQLNLIQPESLGWQKSSMKRVAPNSNPPSFCTSTQSKHSVEECYMWRPAIEILFWFICLCWDRVEIQTLGGLEFHNYVDPC